MQFRTELHVQPSDLKIDIKDPVLTIGSCFSDSIGQRFQDCKFQALVNPLGTTYHPLAIHKILKYAAYQEYPNPHTYLENNGVYFNYDFHSSSSNLQRDALQSQLQESIASLHFFLKKCKVLLVTYGTAWLFERNDTGEPVANCHKMPSGAFTRRLSTPSEIVDSFDEIYKVLSSISPDLKVILTVSPVRHVKDTLPMNGLSKSVLRVACDQIIVKNRNVAYFPSFEIMVDDLRDYRFYEQDMIHPTTAAEEYIWQKFSAAYLNSLTLHFAKEWQEIRKAMQHRPFHPESKAHKTFLRETLARIEQLRPVIDVGKELEEIKNQL